MRCIHINSIPEKSNKGVLHNTVYYAYETSNAKNHPRSRHYRNGVGHTAINTHPPHAARNGQHTSSSDTAIYRVGTHQLHQHTFHAARIYYSVHNKKHHIPRGGTSCLLTRHARPPVHRYGKRKRNAPDNHNNHHPPVTAVYSRHSGTQKKHPTNTKRRNTNCPERVKATRHHPAHAPERTSLRHPDTDKNHTTSLPPVWCPLLTPAVRASVHPQSSHQSRYTESVLF